MNEGLKLSWLCAVCILGRLRCPGPERVQQAPCLTLRNQEEEEEEEAVLPSRATAGTVRQCLKLHIGQSNFCCTKVIFLPAGASHSRERGSRDPKILNDKTGSLHLGMNQTGPAVEPWWHTVVLCNKAQCSGWYNLYLFSKRWSTATFIFLQHESIKMM